MYLNFDVDEQIFLATGPPSKSKFLNQFQEISYTCTTHIIKSEGCHPGQGAHCGRLNPKEM